MNTTKVTRLEVIDQNGRAYVNMSCEAIGFSLQDNDCTLKIFIQSNG